MPTAPGPRATCRVGGNRAGGVARSATGGGANTSTPCHCEGVRSTLKTLSYDCGNPVQYVCGHPPAVLFYLLDRHASLAMTKGSKWIITYSLTTPGLTTHATHRAGPGVAHPSNGGELSPQRKRNKFPSAEGYPQGGVVHHE